MNLNTICEEAKCPNRNECYAAGTATLLILGERCTRHCGFCAVRTAKPMPADSDEPNRVAEFVSRLGLRYAVITSPARDDLPDEGAGQFVKTIEALRRLRPMPRVEVLVPDFHAEESLLIKVLEARPDVFAHNVETVERLQRLVRPHASYERSLNALMRAKRLAPEILTKSGLMVGLGESDCEILKALMDLRAAGCDILTIGQYLQPTQKHLSVMRYVPPETFEGYREWALALGFRAAASGPFVRSSYKAWEVFADEENSAF